MDIVPDITSRPHTRIVVLVGTLLVVAVLGLPSLLYPLHADQATFAYIGDIWLHGRLPYRDAWDVKGPGIFAVYSLAQLIFGRSMVSAHLADLAAAILAAAGLFAVAARELSPKAAALAPLAFGIAYYTGFGYQETAQVESFAAPVTVGLVYCLCRSREHTSCRWPILAGLCLGALLLFKIVFALSLFLLPAVSYAAASDLPRRSRFRAAFQLVGGALILPLVAWAYFAARGAGSEIPRLLTAQRAYGTPDDPIAVAVWAWKQTIAFFSQRTFLVWLFIAGLATVKSAVHQRGAVQIWWAWLGIAAVTVAVQWRYYAYQFLVILPPLALLAAAGLSEVWRRCCVWRSESARAAVLGIFLVGILTPLAHEAAQFGLAFRVWRGELPREKYWDTVNAVGWYPFSNAAHVAAYVRHHTVPTDQILVFDFDPVIYYLAGRQCPTRHISIAPMFAVTNIPIAIRRAWLNEQAREATARPPLYLVVRDTLRGGEIPLPFAYFQRRGQTYLRYAGRDYRYEERFTQDKIYRLVANDPAGQHSP